MTQIQSGFIASRRDIADRVRTCSSYCFWLKMTFVLFLGMVFAINAPADPNAKSFTNFKAKAIAINGTSSSTSSSAVTTDSSYTTPPPPAWQTATATVSSSDSTWVTTYTSYDGTPCKYCPSIKFFTVAHKLSRSPYLCTIRTCRPQNCSRHQRNIGVWTSKYQCLSRRYCYFRVPS